MQIYHFDDAGVYTKTSQAALDPKETEAAGENRYLIPANATDITAPAMGANQTAVFDGAWTITPDHRGEVWWDENGDVTIIDFVGDPALAGYSDTAPPPPAPTANDVIAERVRRMALGFDYDFADGRGVHHFGTSEQDMVGWGEVTSAAQALINSAQPLATIDIKTETGDATVTAMEWQAILVAAAAVRQPLWLASFALQEMNPIPSDYTDDSYWT